MNTPKRAVHMTTVHHPYDPRIYHKECYSLVKAGFDVTLIAQASTETAQTYEDITHIPVKTYTNRVKRMIFGSIAAYRQAKKLQADVYHFHDPELLLIGWLRSEEHTSELQSRGHLVCRLLLEKKKKKNQ